MSAFPQIPTSPSISPFAKFKFYYRLLIIKEILDINSLVHIKCLNERKESCLWLYRLHLFQSMSNLPHKKMRLNLTLFQRFVWMAHIHYYDTMLFCPRNTDSTIYLFLSSSTLSPRHHQTYFIIKQLRDRKTAQSQCHSGRFSLYNLQLKGRSMALKKNFFLSDDFETCIMKQIYLSICLTRIRWEPISVGQNDCCTSLCKAVSQDRMSITKLLW